MRNGIPAWIVLSCLLIALAAPGAAEGRLVNERFPYEVGRWIHLAMDMGGVKIEDVKFHKPAKWKGVLTRHDKPNRATIVVRNTGAERVDLGVAIALFDEEGRLLAAGNSGATIGVLQPGERHELHVSFHSVYRQIDEADHFVLAAEF